MKKVLFTIACWCLVACSVQEVVYVAGQGAEAQRCRDHSNPEEKVDCGLGNDKSYQAYQKEKEALLKER